MMSLFLQRRVRLLSRELKRKFLVWLVLGICLAAAGFIIVIAGTSTPEPDIACAIVKSSARQRDSSTENLPAAKSRAVTFLAVGDIMLSRTVAAKIKAHQDVNYPFLKTCVLLSSADFAFGNLETSITEGPIIKSGSMMFRADPGVEDALAANEFMVLSLANNHTPNYGQKGLLDTFEYLRGAGRNAEEARKPIIVKRSGLRIAFLAYNDTDVVPASYEASTDKAGTASDSEDITITVTNVNRLPELALIGNREVSEGELLEFTVSAGDLDLSDTLVLTASNLPQNASFVDNGNRTGTFYFL